MDNSSYQAGQAKGQAQVALNFVPPTLQFVLSKLCRTTDHFYLLTFSCIERSEILEINKKYINILSLTIC